MVCTLIEKLLYSDFLMLMGKHVIYEASRGIKFVFK